MVHSGMFGLLCSILIGALYSLVSVATGTNCVVMMINDNALFNAFIRVDQQEGHPACRQLVLGE